MEYDELVFNLNSLTNYTQEPIIKKDLQNLSWQVSKCGISGLVEDPSVDLEGSIDFYKMIDEFSVLSKKSEDKKTRKVLNKLIINLSTDGLDGIKPQKKCMPSQKHSMMEKNNSINR